MLEQAGIDFGSIDAKHEVFAQARMGQDIFYRSFSQPPGLNEFSLMQGAKFFIIGQKGSGKTALLRFLQQEYIRNGHKTDIVLFKSDLNEDERQRLIAGHDVSVIEAIQTANRGADYKSNWLWFILTQLSYMLTEDDLISGCSDLEDLKTLTGAAVRPKQSIFSGLRIQKIKGDIAASVAAGVFKSQAKAEIEAIKNSSDKPDIDVIETAERCICRIKLKPNKRVGLFFDELELFTTQSDQRTRDMTLIRDLLYAVARINRKIGAESASIVIYAAIRSEILNELNVMSEEINKETDDFGIRIEWDIRSKSNSQPLIELVSKKIRASEVEAGIPVTLDVWQSYFPQSIYGKDFRQHLLDISMFRPRNLIRRLNGAKRRDASLGFSVGDFQDSQLEFSNGVWKEIEDELRVGYKPDVVRAIKQIFSGWRDRFDIFDLEQRIDQSVHVPSVMRNQFRTRESITVLLDVLYRAGAIGNMYQVLSGNRKEVRDRWVFRGFSEPLFDKEFAIHESIRKALQLTYS